MHNGKALKKADPSTIQNKLLVGYQGWFTCAGDGDPVGRNHHGWLHWFDFPVPDGGRPNTDIWPDVSEYDPSELFEAPGLKSQTGDKVYLFSSRNQKTVDRHFNWMAQHGVDGAFLQRFAGQCDGRGENTGIRRIRDEVGERVREAAEKNGRVYAIMYDVSGVPPGKIEEIIKYDWKYLVFNKRVFDSPNYLREKGKPVVALWGFGFEDSHHTPGLVRSIASYINSSHPGGVYLMAGVPAHWRTSTGDADRNPEFVDVWLDHFDAISPWTIGRYGNPDEADKYAEEKMAGDVKLITERNQTARMGKKVDYIPVVFPGGSGFNLSEGKWGFNNIPREGGRFLWRQIYNARRLGVRTIYGAMWDEYDEGTALMPIVTHKNQLPQPVREYYKFLAPDADNHDLPSDWYMRICGMVVEILRGNRRLLETFPHKELQDYWGTRPRYQDGTCGGYTPASSSTSEAGGSGTKHTLPAEELPSDEPPPPPPYSLEAGNDPAESASSTRDGFTTAPTSPNNQQNYGVSNLTNDLGRHNLGGSSSQSPTQHIPGGFNSPPTSPPHAGTTPSQTTTSPVQAFANRPSSPTQSVSSQSSSYFSPPSASSQENPMPSMPSHHGMHPADPNPFSVNLNTPFHWGDDYPNPHTGQGKQPSYAGQIQGGPPPSNPPPQSYGQQQSTYPGITSSSSSVTNRPPPTHPSKTHTWPHPGPTSPPLSQGPGDPGQQQYAYPGMTGTPPPGRQERPPTHPSIANPHSYRQPQPNYPGMSNSPSPIPDRPPTSHASRPTTPYHHPSLPPQGQVPPLPGRYDYPQGPTQPTYGGVQPSVSPPQTVPTVPYQQTVPGQYGYQPPPQQQQQHSPYSGYNPHPGTSPYTAYPGTYQPPPIPPPPQDMPPSAGGPSGPGFNQSPYHPPYSQPQQPSLPLQGYGGPSTGLSYSASYSNATGAWKRQPTGVLGLAKDTVDKIAGRETRKNMQSSVQNVLKPFMK